MSATIFGRQQKVKKKHWLKHPKEVPEKINFAPKYKWFLFLKSYFWHITFLYSSTRSSGNDKNFFLNFPFFSRKSQGQQKLANKITYFRIQLFSKNLILWTSTSTSMPLKIICSHNIAKNLFHFTNFLANICRNGAVPFLEAQELHSRSTFKANVFIFLYISVRNFLFQRSSKILSGEGMRGIRWRWWLNNFLKADHCLGLVKRYTIYHFNWNFGNSTIFYSLLC